MKNWQKSISIILILLLAAYLRFYNLMHDEPYFFNPDERNMAAAITQLRLPQNINEIPNCILSELITHNSPARDASQSDAGGQPITINCNLNPHFYAYGQFPLYLSFISDLITTKLISFLPHYQLPITNYLSTSFPSAIFWLRFWSALASTITILFVFLISKQIFNSLKFNSSIANCQLPIISAIFAVFTPGLIQSAHFGTTESLLAFFLLISVYLSLKMISKVKENKSPNPFALNIKYLILISLTTGLAFGSKLTGLFCLFPVLIGYLIQISRLFKSKISKLKKTVFLVDNLFIGLIFVLFTIIFCIIFSPYNLIDQKDFLGAVFGYEQDVATGKYEAFYTRQFTDTVPVLFQMKKVFPYALGWPIFVMGTIGFFIMIFCIFKTTLFTFARRIKNLELGIKKNKEYIYNSYFLILASCFLIYLLPNAFLFAKWTRFMTPIFPFFVIFSAFALLKIYSVLHAFRSQFPISLPRRQAGNFQFPINVISANWLIGLLVFIGLLPGIAFFSIYTRPDSRVQASEWIYENIPDKSYILSETANVIDIPLALSNRTIEQSNNYKVISFDFYHMDENPAIFEILPSHLEKADYIFVPSRRIFANHMTQSKKYPLTTKYYQLLFSGRLGFEKVAEISSFSSLTLTALHLTLPDEKAEETFTVFDHPVIRIYKKTLPFYTDQYKRMLKN